MKKDPIQAAVEAVEDYVWIGTLGATPNDVKDSRAVVRKIIRAWIKAGGGRAT